MQLQGKKCGVFGLGISGISAAKFLIKQGVQVFIVNQGQPSSWGDLEALKGATLISQDDPTASEQLARCELVVLSPGIPRTHPILLPVHSQGVPVISEIELAYPFVNKAPILAITGSNGKTTTVTLLAKSLEAIGKKVFLGGNIGTPLCELAIDHNDVDFIVLELSSFQLESMLTFRAQVSAIINLTMNHGERYKDFEDYARAKFHITDRQEKTDAFIFDSDALFITEWSERLECQKITSCLHDKKQMLDELQKDFDLSKLLLPGDHNLANLRIVQEFFRVLKLDLKGIQNVINTFPGVSHRVEFVKHNGPFICYNDAKSTNWDATLAALKSMAEKSKPLWLILGGQPRGFGEEPNEEFKKYVREHVDMVLVIGAAQSFVQKMLSHDVKVFLAENLDGVVSKIKEHNFSGTLLFSPAFPSFDQFKNYADRGNSFKNKINEIDWSKQ